jgi:hypothetical protein
VANSPPRNVEIKGQPHMLSYITPEEGDILQSLGGSGAPGPMGIPSFYDGDGGVSEGMDEADASAAADAAGMGVDGFDDPAAVADPVGIAHGLGITDVNPYGRNVPGFIQGLSNIFGPLDYSNIFSPQQMADIKGKHLGVTMNPNNVKRLIGFDKNQAPNQPRSGIQKGFGSLFGRPTGQVTTLGPIAAQRSANPQNALALSIFGMMTKGTPLSLINAIVGPPQTYAVKDSIGYSRGLDPAVSGNKGLGTIADALSIGLTGNTSAGLQDSYGAITSLAPDMFNDVTNAVTDALSFNDTKGKAGTVDSTGTVNSVATNPNMNAKGIDYGIGSLGIDKSYRDTMKNNTIKVREGDLSPLY